MLGHKSYLSVNWQSPVDWTHPLNRGRVAWWLCAPHRSGGKIWRDLISNRILTLTNMDPATDWVTGSTSHNDGRWGALDFDGSNDYVTGTSPVASGLSGISVACWTSVTTNQLGYLVSLANGSLSNGVDIYLNSTNSIRAWMNTTGANTGLTGTFTYAGTGWIRILSSYDGTNHKLYVNGKEINTVAKTGTVNVGFNDLTVGDFQSGGYDPAAAVIDDVSIWNRGLTPGEAVLDHELGHQFNRGLLRLWQRRFFCLGLPNFNPAWARGSNVIMPGVMA